MKPEDIVSETTFKETFELINEAYENAVITFDKKMASKSK